MMDYRKVLDQLDSTRPHSFDGESPSNLLCLSVSQRYIDSDLKVMVFGQETNDWYGSYSDKHNEQWLKDSYEEFFNSDYCFSYGGQFWNGVSRTIDLLESRTGKSVGLLWNNIVKIGKEGEKGLPNQIILDWQAEAMSFIIEEISITKPDVVIFFSGPNYDNFLCQVFEDVTFKELSDKTPRQLSLLQSKHLPVMSFRTYHPNYLWRNDINSYLNDIIDFIEVKN